MAARLTSRARPGRLGTMTRDPASISRRRFLVTAGWAAGAVVLAACTRQGTASPSLVPSPTPTVAGTPSPSPVATPAVTLREKIGQMLLVGFRGTTVAEASAVVADIRERHLGGVVLFDRDQPTGSPVRNIVSPTQLRDLVAGLQGEAATPLTVAVDEEGGLVARLDPSRVPGHDLGGRAGPAGDADFTSPGGEIGETLRGRDQPQPGAGGRPQRQPVEPDHRRGGPLLLRGSGGGHRPGRGVHPWAPRHRRPQP